MAQKWNLQDIRPPSTQRERSAHEQHERPHQDIGLRRPPEDDSGTDKDIEVSDIVGGKSSQGKKAIVSIVVALLVVGAGYAANVLLTGARVTVYPKYHDVPVVDAKFTAYKQPQVGDLGYELLTLEATSEKQVTSSGQEKVSTRAEGDIKVFNTSTGASQRLIKNTRFQSQSGLVFRITDSVEIPSAKKDATGKVVPGVVTAHVIADGTGDQYNLAPGRFSVPGLKGSPQYDSVYGESAIAFARGFEGSRYIIDPAELETTKQALDLELRNLLLARLKNERPAGFIVYDGAVTFAFDNLPATSYGEKMATIKERARLQIPMFKESEFAKFVAKSTVAGYEDEAVAITDPTLLTFAYTSPTTTKTDIATLSELTFNLKGGVQVVWLYDENKLKNEIVGKQKTALPNILATYPAISRAEAVIRPFWSQKFPDNPNEIKVSTVVGGKPAP